MKNGRLVWSCVGLSLPTILVVALSVLFYIDKLPKLEKTERDRVKAIYRETALFLQKNQATQPLQPIPRHVKLKSAGKMAPGRWGYLPVPHEQMTRVWYQEGKAYTVGRAALVPETNYRLLFTAFGSFFLVVLVGVTFVGIRCFAGYMKSRDDFLAATAHDLMTPLVGLRLMIGRHDEEARKLNERMILLVNNIKDFLKLGGRRQAPRRQVVDLVALTREAYGLFAADYAESAGGEVVFETGDAGKDAGAPSVLADETMTLQILWNLFGNDLKYAAPFGRVVVRFATAGRQRQVSFVDEGPGLSPRQMKRAFDRYYRAKTVLQSGKGGFGIGLCTAREFARAMGGDLMVRANRPKGCVFTLTLPCA